MQEKKRKVLHLVGEFDTIGVSLLVFFSYEHIRYIISMVSLLRNTFENCKYESINKKKNNWKVLYEHLLIIVACLQEIGLSHFG
jgi:hypothetical protein